MAAACGGGSDEVADNQNDAATSGGNADAAARNDTGSTTATMDSGAVAFGGTTNLGGFKVALYDLVKSSDGTVTAAHTTVEGKVFEGAGISNLVWTVDQEASGCRLSIPKPPFCSPRCTSDAICVADGKCQNEPASQDLGTVHVKGVGAEFDMTQIKNNYQPSGDISLPYPAAAEGAAIRISTAGGARAPFILDSSGIAPLVAKGPFPAVTGKAMALKWNAPGQAGQTRMELSLDISHHGGIKGKIECDVPDTGTFDIPAAQITRLLGLGYAGYPTIYMTRVTTGKADVAGGHVELRVQMQLDLPVTIDGLTSCTEDKDCPKGKTCQTDLSCTK